jgi:hypothetical protein
VVWYMITILIARIGARNVFPIDAALMTNDEKFPECPCITEHLKVHKAFCCDKNYQWEEIYAVTKEAANKAAEINDFPDNWVIFHKSVSPCQNQKQTVHEAIRLTAIPVRHCFK